MSEDEIAVDVVIEDNEQALVAVADDIIKVEDDDWSPRSDWYDIEKILEEDEEDYKQKIAILLKDYDDIWTYDLQYQLSGKIKFSDGQVLENPVNGDYITWDQSKDKECKKGYNTRYIIVYIDDDKVLNMSYKAMSDLAKYYCLYIIFQGVEKIQCNSNFNLSNLESLECIKMNNAILISSNLGMAIENACSLKKIDGEGFVRTISSANSSIVMSTNYGGRNITSDMLKKFFNFEYTNEEYKDTLTLQLQMFTRTCYDEHINIEEITGIPANHVISVAREIRGPKSIEELDFENVTSWGSGVCHVYSINKISNIKASNSFFNGTWLDHDSLVRVLEALYDYSDSEDTYTLTLRKYSFSKIIRRRKRNSNKQRLDFKVERRNEYEHITCNPWGSRERERERESSILKRCGGESPCRKMK